MKKLGSFLFLTLILTPLQLFAAELQRLPVVASITAVTVFADRALVSRSATLNMKAGSYLLTFSGLPALIQDDSVRVAGKGSAVVSIAGLEVKRLFLEQSGEKRVQELDEEIRALELRLGVLDAKKAGLVSQKAFLESIRVAWGERISKELAVGRPTAAELNDAAGFVAAGVTRAEEQSLDIETGKRSLRDKIDSLRRQRDEAVGSVRKESKTVEVLVHVTREGSLTLDLATVMPQAGWVPAYDVRLAADTRTAELTFRALVRQQTGEDWNNVDLTLSTARPAAGGAPPQLNPWRIALYRPLPVAAPMALRAAPPAAMVREKSAQMAERMYEAAEADGAGAEDRAATFETARISEEQSSVAFHLPRSLDIPADGSQHGSVVASEQLPVTLEYLALPKKSPLVFLRSEIVNRAAYPLLPGKVNTFVGNTYTGSSLLKKVAVGEKFDLFFGADDQVTVKREELKQHREAGLFGRNRVSYRYRIELHNFRKEPLTLTLRDQLPLAADEEIKVSLEEPSIKPDEVDSEGRIIWRTPLLAGEKKAITFGIMVEYPKDRELIGL